MEEEEHLSPALPQRENGILLSGSQLEVGRRRRGSWVKSRACRALARTRARALRNDLINPLRRMYA